VQPDDVFLPVPVVLGKRGEVQPVLQENTPVLLSREQAANVRKELELCADVAAPVEAGQKLGELRVICGDKQVAAVPIVAAESVAKLRVFDIFGLMFRSLLMGDGAK